MVGPIFFEIIQRKGDEGFGEGNFRALVRIDRARPGEARRPEGQRSRMPHEPERRAASLPLPSRPRITICAATTRRPPRTSPSTQDWNAYTEAEHALWRKLYQRQAALMPKYAAQGGAGFAGRSRFQRRRSRTSTRCRRSCGARPAGAWSPCRASFPMRRSSRIWRERHFPVTIWLRKPEEIDYLVEPDIFHDFFGHVPLLFDPVFADFLQLYGEQGRGGGTPRHDAVSGAALSGTRWSSA